MSSTFGVSNASWEKIGGLVGLFGLFVLAILPSGAAIGVSLLFAGLLGYGVHMMAMFLQYTMTRNRPDWARSINIIFTVTAAWVGGMCCGSIVFLLVSFQLTGEANRESPFLNLSLVFGGIAALSHLLVAYMIIRRRLQSA